MALNHQSSSLRSEPHWALRPWRRGRVHAPGGDELRHSLLQHRQRNRAERQDGVVEVALVELGAQLFLRLATMPADLQLAKLVRQGLPGPRDVAVDLSGDLVV